MSSYVGRHAELYDLFYSTKPYADEALFIHQCLERFGEGTTHRLLELACGTGAHALALEKLGYEIVATDYSEDMLSVARRKAARVSSRVEFQRKDMRALAESPEPFDAVICLFDAIGYVATNGSLHQVMQGVYSNVRSRGLFIFEFWHAGAMLSRYEPVRVRRWTTPEGEVLRIAETTLAVADQLAKVHYTVYELSRDGTYTNFQETQTNRYFLVQEMAMWLSTCGFAPLEWYAGFTTNSNISESTWHVVAVARRQS